MKIQKRPGRSYTVEIDNEFYTLNRVGPSDDNLMFNFQKANHGLVDYYIVLHFFNNQWIYRDWDGDIIDNDLFYKVTSLIDEGVKNGIIRYRRRNT